MSGERWRFRLEFGVGVRADFAVQVDFFVLRSGPFHELGSLGKIAHKDKERITRVRWEGKRGRGNGSDYPCDLSGVETALLSEATQVSYSACLESVANMRLTLDNG